MVWMLLLTALAAEPESLFDREWTADQGLGPRFNARSCATCHAQGGSGGAGEAAHDVFTLPSGMVVHADSLEQGYAETREHLMNPTFEFREGMCGTAIMQMVASRTPRRRQTPALFGLGLLDAVSETELLVMEKSQGRDFPEVSGRIARDAEGAPGRFGWKAQQTTLAGAVSNAAANEVGLQPDELTAVEFAQLVAEVRAFEAPRAPVDSDGSALFDRVGCSSCHAARIGEVEGAFTDLLVHDMGFGLADEGMGYGVREDPREDAVTATEWRTPPLWGIALSAPYLHDGRAKTLDQAIAAHGGEADAIRRSYAELEPPEQAQLLAFLEGLGAPE